MLSQLQSNSMDQDIQAIQSLFPNYKVKSHLGNGAFASVYLAKEQLTNIQVAIKKINCFGMCQYQKSSSINQAKILSSLSCDNIIKLKACHFDEKEDNLYLVMEFADGGDLGQVIITHMDERKRIPQDLIWKWVNELANALQYMHKNRIIHRDIKPGNIFLTKSKDIKIGDMNISRFLQNGFAAVTKVGSPYYISPEVWIGNGYNQKCDIWSLGIVTYQLCCHQVPFQNHEIGNFTKGKLTKRQLIIPSQYSIQLKDLISKMLQVNPQTRLSSSEVKQICNMRSRRSESFCQSVNSLMMDTLPTKKSSISKIVLNHKPLKPEKIQNDPSQGHKMLNSAYFHKKVKKNFDSRAKSTKCITPERKQNLINNSSKLTVHLQEKKYFQSPDKQKRVQVCLPDKKTKIKDRSVKKTVIRSQSIKSKMASLKTSCNNRVLSPICDKRTKLTVKQNKNADREAKKDQYSIYYR